MKITWVFLGLWIWLTQLSSAATQAETAKEARIGRTPVAGLRALPRLMPQKQPISIVESNIVDLDTEVPSESVRMMLPVPGGAVAEYGLQKAFFPLNARGDKPLTITTAEGRILKCRATFLSAHDLKTDQRWLIAEVTNCIGVIVGPDQVIYTNAFDTILADLRFRYTTHSLEQDILLHENVILPEGFSPETTRLEVWSEWFDSEPKSKITQAIELRSADAAAEALLVDDQTLNFGASIIGAGHAFSADAEHERIPVGKLWERIEERDWLIEVVDFQAVQSKLEQLPTRLKSRTSSRRNLKREELIRSLAQVDRSRVSDVDHPMRLAQLSPVRGREFVMDFIIVSTVPLPAGVISWWPAGGSTNDAFGTNKANWVGGASYSSGKVGQSFSFSGSNHLVVSNAASLNPTNGVTVEGWVWLNAGASDFRSIAIKGDATVDWSYWLLVNDYDNTIYAMVNNYEYVLGTNSLTANAWHHLAMTYHVANQTLALYVDGQLDSVVTATGGLPTNSSSLLVGNGGSGSYPLYGKIDELSIYNRALGATEIQAIFNSGIAGKVNPSCVTVPPNIIGWWPGDGNAYDLARTNTAAWHGSSAYVASMVSDGFQTASGDFWTGGTWLEIPDQPAFNMTNELTLEAWVYPTATAYGHRLIMGKDAEYAGRQYLLSLSSVDKFRAHVWANDGTLYYIDAGPTVSLNTWYHVAMTYNRTNLILYVNGAQVGSQSGAKPINVTTQPLRIGASAPTPDGAPYSFPGQIDEAAIYNRALTSSEITSLYIAGGAGKCKADTDGDGLTDLQESFLGTSPTNSDTDYDGRSDKQEVQDGTNPLAAVSVSDVLLGRWTFDNTNSWVGEQGQALLGSLNAVGRVSVRTNAAYIFHTNGAYLKYRDVELNGQANVNCQRGTVKFWFKPEWAGVNVGGSGPQYNGPMFSLGNWSLPGTAGWWGIGAGFYGTNLTFHTQGSGEVGVGTIHFSPEIKWYSNTWHQVAVTYSASETRLYVDGTFVTNGVGIANFPNAANRAAGFSLGSISGANQCRGQFEDLETYNYELSASSISASYDSSPLADADGDGITDKEDADPSNPGIGRLKLTIERPAHGETIY